MVESLVDVKEFSFFWFTERRIEKYYHSNFFIQIRKHKGSYSRIGSIMTNSAASQFCSPEKDMKNYDEVSKKYFMDNPNVKQFYTHVVMDKVKVGYGVNI